MYLVERIIGVAVYVLLLGAVCLFISRARGVGDRRRAVVLYAIVLCVMAFVYVPPKTADLSRITEYMHAWSRLNPIDAVRFALTKTSPAGVLYVYVIGLFGVDGLLPAITSAISFYCIFRIYIDSCERYSLTGREAAAVLALLMSGGAFAFLISNIRCYLAFSLFVLCVGHCAPRSKVLRAAILIVAATMHAACAVTVLAWVIYAAARTGAFSGPRAVLPLSLLAIGAVMYYRGVPLVKRPVSHAIRYITSGGGYSDIWEYLISALLLAGLTIILFSYRGRTCDDPSALLSRLSVVLTLAFAFVYAIFTRFTYLTLLISVPTVCAVTAQSRETSYALPSGETQIHRRLDTVSLLCLLSAALLMLSAGCGNLSGYKFFTL